MEMIHQVRVHNKQMLYQSLNDYGTPDNDPYYKVDPINQPV